MMKKFLFITLIFSVLFCLPVQFLYAADEIDDYMKEMTLEEKIGQIMLIGLRGKTLGSKEIHLLKKIRPGGIVFYGRNFEVASDVPPLISKIKTTLKDSALPLFFAIDQEGGIVHRIEEEYHKPPSAPAIGAINSEELSRELGLAVGNALRELGINVNLAPVLDVLTDLFASPMRKRSYSNDPQTVAELGSAYIAGLHDAGILATAKHFPGIGRAREDTHRTLPLISWKTQDEKGSDMMPFQASIETGIDMIMVGHIIATPGDSENPVSLSSYWMTDVLRKDLGFEGLILVDNIEMKPIENTMPISDAAVKSFNAGADIIMVSHKKRTQEEVFNALIKAVQKGKISRQRLDESLKKIIETKKRIFSKNPIQGARKDLKKLSRFVAENTVTVLSLKNAPFQAMHRDDKVLYAGYSTTMFNAVKDIFEDTDILNTSVSNYKKLHPETPLAEFIKRFDAVLIDSSYTEAPEIISLCDSLNKNYFFLQSFFTDIQRITERLRPKQIILVYESDRENLNAVFEILLGLRQAKGRLPSYINFPSHYVYMSPTGT
jgi:beta-N-acetylhexosaminidase